MLRLMRSIFIYTFLFATIPWETATFAQTAKSPVRIYLNADRTNSRISAQAIEYGIQTALDEVNNHLDGYPVDLVLQDHRGSTPRSRRNLQQCIEDPNALALFGGMHSPPLLSEREEINRNRLPVLVPWAAAGPITRPPTGENWIFRLSIDDSRAGYTIVQHALDHDGFSRPFLMLERTGWGESNEKTMTAALKTRNIPPQGVTWFNWNLSRTGAKILLREIIQSGADVILLVANAAEGANIVRAMMEMPEDQRLPIRSHWGITGGDFVGRIGLNAIHTIDLEFIQTAFSFICKHDRPLAQPAWDRLVRLHPKNIQKASNLRAPTGFIHAYDLTRLLIAAVNQAGLTDDMQANRTRIKEALESLREPVEGLIKTYSRPFAPYTPQTVNAHEALSEKDYLMARYTATGDIIHIACTAR